MNSNALAQKLKTAFQQNDVKGVREALAAGADPNTRFNHATSRSLLFRAIENDWMTMAHMLINAGASIESLDKEDTWGSPWKRALKNHHPLFMVMWAAVPSLSDPQKGINKNPEETPWGWVTTDTESRIIFNAFLDAAHKNNYRFSPSLTSLIAQEVANWENSTSILEALLPLMDDKQRFLEDVALGACNAGTFSAKAERRSRKARAWALQKGATFLDETVELWRFRNVFAKQNLLAVDYLVNFPLTAPGGLNDWIEKQGARASHETIERLLSQSLDQRVPSSFKKLMALWPQTLSWSQRKGKQQEAPLPHQAIKCSLERLRTGDVRNFLPFLRAVCESGHETLATDEYGDTAMHFLIRHLSFNDLTPEGADVLRKSVKILQRAGLSLNTANLEGKTPLDLAKGSVCPGMLELASQWEAQVVNERLTGNLTKQISNPPRRHRI